VWTARDGQREINWPGGDYGMKRQADQPELTTAVTVQAPHTDLARLSEQPTRACEIIMRAVSDPACDPDKMKALLAVRREWNSDEAAAEFNAAVVRFQQQCPIIPKLDKAYDKMYARMDRIWRTIRPLMEECGLAVTWESMRGADGVMVLEGHLRHKRGHAQPLHHEVPIPEIIKGQNLAQRSASAETYAKRYATCAALGIQTGDDDDGNAAGGVAVIDDKQAANLRELCEASGRKIESVLAMAGVSDVAHYPLSAYENVAKMLAEAVNKRRPA
jgi:hypothetical protein